MDNKRRLPVAEVIIGAVQLAVLLVPVHHIAVVIDAATGFDPTLLFGLLCGGLSWVAVFSKTKTIGLIKCAVSLPISAAMFELFSYADFYARALNFVIPRYGEPSRGDMLLNVGRFFTIALGCIIGAAAGIICVVIVAVVVSLLIAMPQYTY